MRRSKAVNGAKLVVGVVGYGHLRGVTYHLLQDAEQLRFRDLAGLVQTDARQGQGWGQLVLSWFGIVTGLWWVAATFWHPI